MTVQDSQNSSMPVKKISMGLEAGATWQAKSPGCPPGLHGSEPPREALPPLRPATRTASSSKLVHHFGPGDMK
ncbi:MAG: hypothetical protein RLZZ165_2212 [Bacteroidota bacterium]